MSDALLKGTNMHKPVFDSNEFRRSLGTFATGVTIITVRSPDGEPIGVTANSFSSVSLDPPLVLWSLAKNAKSLPAFQAAEYFAIHILSAEQEGLSNLFASQGADKFGNLNTEQGIGDTPLLDGCCTRMQCKVAHQYEGGDHIIFVGEVVDLVSNDLTPLVFQAGKYSLAARKTDDTPLISSSSSGFDEDFFGYLLWRAYFQFQSEVNKQAPFRGFTSLEFLILVTLAHNNWRAVDTLCDMIVHDGDHDLVGQALESLVEKGLLQEKADKNGFKLCGLSETGNEKALELLTIAKSTESTFLERLGQKESAALKNLLKGFIVETDTGIPHPWERTEGEA